MISVEQMNQYILSAKQTKTMNKTLLFHEDLVITTSTTQIAAVKTQTLQATALTATILMESNKTKNLTRPSWV